MRSKAKPADFALRWQQWAALPALPLMLVQGLYVRRVTPRLPEPPGPRAGQQGQGPQLRLLLLGDSAAAGVGASHQSEALSGRLSAQLASQFELHWQLSATAGHKTADCLQQLQEHAAQTFDVAVISIGVNDVTAGRSPTRWLLDVDRLLQQLREQHACKIIVVSGLPPMHLFPALPEPLRWYVGVQARRFNLALQSYLGTQKDAVYLPPEYPDELTLIASDGFHPGPGAYAHWATRFAELITSQLSQQTASDF